MGDSTNKEKLDAAFHHIQANQPAIAIPIIQDVLLSDRNDPEAWWLLAIAYSKIDLERSEKALLQLLELRPNSEKAQNALAKIRARRQSSSPTSAAPQNLIVLPQPSHTPIRPDAPTPITGIPLVRVDPISEPVVSASIEPAETPSWMMETSETAQVAELATQPDAVLDDKVSISNAIGSALATFGLSAVGGAYGGATILVGEVILGYVLMALHQAIIVNAKDGLDLFTFLFVIILALIASPILVVAGPIAGVVGGVMGFIAGAALGLIGAATSLAALLVNRGLAYIVSPLVCGGIAVYLYHNHAFEGTLGITSGVTILAYLNYAVIALFGLAVGFFSVPVPDKELDEMQAKMEAEQEAEKALGYVSSDEPKSNPLAAPWKLYRGVLGFSADVGGSVWESSSKSIEKSIRKNERDREWLKIKRQLERR